jgi:hypothetical protein
MASRRYPQSEAHPQRVKNYENIFDRSDSADYNKERMPLRAILFRLVAVLVLITSAFDYYSFDVWDPTAPMSSTRSEIIRDLISHHQTSAKIGTSDLADDQCLGCAPGISPRPPVLHRISLNSFVFQALEAAVASSDLLLIDRPPRA